MVRFLPLLTALALLLGIFAFRGQVVTAIKEEQFKNSPEKTELLSKAYIDKILASNGKWQTEETQAVWFNQNVPSPSMELAAKIMENPQAVLGENNPSDKWIEVDLDKQRLYARQRGEIVYDMAVSTGLPWFPTVTGSFNIWAKVRAQRMTGGSKENGTYYDLPNVPFVQFFYGGYSLHGTYWHNDFGKPRSHGCVNLSIPDAEKLFYWTEPSVSSTQYSLYEIKPEESTRIVIHGTTPTNIY
ncbi:L,D-transpeptidase [Candidatus Microgenomates bacterium]|nr:L,D-transpeptidase [Candidatus Microgenomates bacterium]